MFNWRKPLIYFLLYITGSKIPRYFKEIKKISSAPIEQQKQYQENKLKVLLLYASQNVPYYERVLKEAGVVKNNEVFLENFDKIPILTKQIIRREEKNLISRIKRRGAYENLSGGSTGEPISFFQDKYYNEWNTADKLFIKKNNGQNVGDKELRLWGSERDLLEGKEKFSIRVRNWIYNRTEINAFKLSETSLTNFVLKWNKFKPNSVESYVHPLHELARFIKNRQIKIFFPRSITTSAGTLYFEIKKDIEEVFGCKVFNRYGSREAGNIACSNDDSGELRINFWNNYVEVLDHDEKAVLSKQSGKVYITTLNNFIMPLIRYNIGDMATLSTNYGKLEKIEGREMNMLKTKSGKMIPCEFFILFVGITFNKNCFFKYQLIQKSLDLLEIKVVLKNKNSFEEQKEKIETCIRGEMSDDNLVIRWVFVDDIPPLPSGKYCYSISEI